MTAISVSLTCFADTTQGSFGDDGAKAVEIATALAEVPFFAGGYQGHFQLSDPAPYLARAAQGNFQVDPASGDKSVHHVFVARDELDEGRAVFTIDVYLFKVGDVGTTVVVEFRGLRGTAQLNAFTPLEVTRRLLPLLKVRMVRCMPAGFADHSALDRARISLGWCGWVPFALTPAQVPQAALVEPLDTGTFLASSLPRFRSYGPVQDAAGIAAAQDLELSLNALGVLPTSTELRSGSWGD